MSSNLTIWRDGLWDNNPGFVQLLGLCPLLAVSNSVVNALGMGLATLFTLLMSNTLISLSRDFLKPEIRMPAFVLIIASIVTSIELILHAYFYELYNALGIFLPLIVTNCIIMGRAEAYAARNKVGKAIQDGLAQGLGFMLVLVMLGVIRESIGRGTLFANAHLLLGEGADLTIQINPEYGGFLIAILPPGAFFALGLLIALKNMIDERMKSAKTPASISIPVTINS